MSFSFGVVIFRCPLHVFRVDFGESYTEFGCDGAIVYSPGYGDT